MKALVLAPGEDLDVRDIARLAEHADLVVGCNLTIRKEPYHRRYHDYCVVSDWQCVAEYHADFVEASDRGVCLVTPSCDVAKQYPWIDRMQTETPPTDGGLNPDGAPIWHLGTSGHAAIGLAWAFLCNEGLPGEIWLLGFTCTGKHFHGDHTGLCEKKGHLLPVNGWVTRHHRIASAARQLGVPIRDFTRSPCGAYEPGDWTCLPS